MKKVRTKFALIAALALVAGASLHTAHAGKKKVAQKKETVIPQKQAKKFQYIIKDIYKMGQFLIKVKRKKNQSLSCSK